MPAVSAIRQANPDAEITWVINPEWTTLLRGNPDVDHVHIFPRGDFAGLQGPLNVLPWLGKTRQLRPEVALDFQGLLRSALIGRISGASQLWGMSDGREGSRLFYHQVAKVNRRAHAVERYLKLAEAFGATVTLPLQFPLPSGDPLPRFDLYPPFVVLHPFARGARKSLGTQVIQKLCQDLAPARVVLVGRTSRRMTLPENCVDLANQTSLLQLIWLIRAAEFTISVDSGPTHIAAAISPHLVSIHTWSDPARVGPYRHDAWVWKNGQLVRVRDLGEISKSRKGRPFSVADIPPLLELVGACWRSPGAANAVY